MLLLVIFYNIHYVFVIPINVGGILSSFLLYPWIEINKNFKSWLTMLFFNCSIFNFVEFSILSCFLLSFLFWWFISSSTFDDNKLGIVSDTTSSGQTLLPNFTFIWSSILNVSNHQFPFPFLVHTTICFPTFLIDLSQSAFIPSLFI